MLKSIIFWLSCLMEIKTVSIICIGIDIHYLFLGNMTLYNHINIINFVVVQSLSRVWLFETLGLHTPGHPVLNHLPELAQSHVRWVADVIPFSSCLQSLPASESFLSQFFTSGGPAIGASASASNLPMKIQA